MAPIILQTMGELASQLTQEFGDRDTQILRLEEENARLRALEEENICLRTLEVENARLRTFEAENARLRSLEGENARLRALLEEAVASNHSSFTTTTATPGLESQSRGITAEDRQQLEDALVDEACNVIEVEGARSRLFPGVASRRVRENSRRNGCQFNWPGSSSDDDEDPGPMPKKEKAPVTAAVKDSATRTSHLDATVAAGANKRKRAAESSSSASSRLSGSLRDLVVDGPETRGQRQPTLDPPANQESETRPAKKPRPASSSSRQKEAPTTSKQTPKKKSTHPPHASTPLQKSHLQRSTYAAPPPPSREQQQQQPSSSRHSGSSGSRSDNRNNNITNPNNSHTRPRPSTRQKKPASTTGQQKSTESSSTISKPTYAEITPFTFKFVCSYATPPCLDKVPELNFHDSASLEDTMSSFWKTLTSIRDTWEEQAGAEWAWEVQKKAKTRGSGTSKRVCVSSKLEKKATKWRPGDDGFYACLNCAMAAKPCFTWVRDEDGGDGKVEDNGEVFDAPKGEFWCLPVHLRDRRCVNVDGKEIRIWVNEGESSSDEGDSGEESGSGAVDEYDDGELASDSYGSSEESSKEHGNEGSDGEL